MTSSGEGQLRLHRDILSRTTPPPILVYNLARRERVAGCPHVGPRQPCLPSFQASKDGRKQTPPPLSARDQLEGVVLFLRDVKVLFCCCHLIIPVFAVPTPPQTTTRSPQTKQNQWGPIGNSVPRESRTPGSECVHAHTEGRSWKLGDYP